MIDVWMTLQRIDARAILDILLVASVFFGLMLLLRGTRAVQLLRGMIILVILITILASTLRLEAFSWLIQQTLPALLLALPVIFQPELRRALERLGRAGNLFSHATWEQDGQEVIRPLVQTAERLSEKRTGMLVVLERDTGLQEYIDTGVPIGAKVTPELLMTIFFKDTLLHDGAVIIRAGRIVAAACVLPLSTSPRLTDRQMGLRHRAALGISEVSDAVAVIVSEETGHISVAHNGRMIRRLDAPRLESILRAFQTPRIRRSWLRRAGSGQRPVEATARNHPADQEMSGSPSATASDKNSISGRVPTPSEAAVKDSS